MKMLHTIPPVKQDAIFQNMNSTKSLLLFILDIISILPIMNSKETK